MVGRTSNSAVKATGPSAFSASGVAVTSTSGREIGVTSASAMAAENQVFRPSLTAWSTTISRPKRCSIRRAGILPLRKPGIWTWLAMSLNALSRAGFTSSNGTSTVSLTRVGLRFSAVDLTTDDSCWWWWMVLTSSRGDRI